MEEYGTDDFLYFDHFDCLETIFAKWINVCAHNCIKRLIALSDVFSLLFNVDLLMDVEVAKKVNQLLFV